MDSDKKKKTREGVPFFASLQVKYALSYLVVITLVLALLNTYPVLASQELLFTSKRDSPERGDRLGPDGAGDPDGGPGGAGDEPAG